MRRFLVLVTATTMVLAVLALPGAGADPIVTQYTGTAGDASVEAGFAAATSEHVKEFIDFDGDGFDGLAAHTFTPIPSNHYASQGVTLLGLDARSVGTQPWAHSPPIGAWQTGFSNPTNPYSFVFDQPIASFGMFGNDVEGAIAVTVHLDGGGTESFTVPAQGGASITTFFGFAAAASVITRIDFDSPDYHIIDDIQFGRSLDSDGDGIEDTVDVEPLNPSTVFLDGAGTTGEILSNDTGQPILVGDLTDPDGVQISVGGVSGQATIRVCGFFTMQVPAGSQLNVSCGSVIVEVVAGGPVVVELDGLESTSVSIPAGVSAEVSEPVGNDFTVEHRGGAGVVTVSVDGVVTTIGPGDPPVMFSRDTDDDGILNVDDVCADTTADSIAPEDLKKRHYAWYGPDGADLVAGGDTDPVFNIADTGGCSGEQIIEALGLGAGHLKHGLSLSALRTWVAGLNGS